jgi:hypothetical protein
MGLDKWLKPEDDTNNTKKKRQSPDQTNKSKSEKAQKKLHEKPSTQLTKYTMVCPNAKCKYQKIIMKKNLTDEDITCPRCNKEMKAKKE